MPLDIPTTQQIFNRQASDVINEIDNLDPFLKNSFIRSILVAFANVASEIYSTIEQVELLTFWDTTEGAELLRWAAIFGITPNPSTIATGSVTFTGIDATTIPLNSQFNSTNGQTYQTTVLDQIETTILSVATMTRVSSTVSVTTTASHGFSSNISIIISGAVETDYNGTFKVVVTGLNTFTYSITGTPTTPATGVISATSTFANVTVESLSFGSSNNLESGESVSLSSPIAGVDDTGFVSFVGVTGGTDEESDDSLRNRFLFRVQNPVANFNVSAIELQAKTVTGVTRVFIQTPNSLLGSVSSTTLERFDTFAKATTASPHGLFDGQIVTVTNANQTEYNVVSAKILKISSTEFGYIVSGTPASPATGPIVVNFSVTNIGQVRIFFVRDNDGTGLNIIPSAGEVSAVKDQINKIRPADIQDQDVIVSGPTGNVIPFTFSALSPNTASMQTAISENLQSFFSSGTTVGVNLKKIDYESIINSTVDSGGNLLDSFTLSTPTTDITIGVSELPILGTITYP